VALSPQQRSTEKFLNLCGALLGAGQRFGGKLSKDFPLPFRDLDLKLDFHIGYATHEHGAKAQSSRRHKLDIGFPAGV
jgi:hypothetical protein